VYSGIFPRATISCRNAGSADWSGRQIKVRSGEVISSAFWDLYPSTYSHYIPSPSQPSCSSVFADHLQPSEERRERAVEK
jgi:hypothetical protein